MQLEDYDNFPAKSPLIIEDDIFLYPFMIAPLFIDDESNKKSIDYAIANNKLITVTVTTPKNEGKRGTTSFYNVGVVGNIMRKVTLPDGRLKVLFQGLEKVIIQEVVGASPLIAIVDVLQYETANPIEVDAALSLLNKNIKTLSKLNAKFPVELLKTTEESDDANRIADLVSSVIQLTKDDAYELFRETNIVTRLLKLIEYI